MLHHKTLLIFFILIVLLSFSSSIPSFAQVEYVQLGITILDYQGRMIGDNTIKFVVNQVISGNTGKFSFYSGKVLTLPLEGDKLKDVTLFDEGEIKVRQDVDKTIAYDLIIKDKYHRDIKLPLGLKTDLYCDKSVYKRGEKVTFIIKAKNNGKRTIALPLPTAKQYDFIVRDKNGRIVWQWSEGKLFITMLQTMIFALREEKTFQETWDMKDNSGKKIPPGLYFVEGFIATNPPYPAGAGKMRLLIK